MEDFINDSAVADLLISVAQRWHEGIENPLPEDGQKICTDVILEAKGKIHTLQAEARKQGRQDSVKKLESIVFQACDEANLSGPDKRDVMQFVTEALRQKKESRK